MSGNSGWIYADSKFNLCYPELKKIISEELSKYHLELEQDTKLGRSASGNLKILPFGGDLIVVSKNDLPNDRARIELRNLAGQAITTEIAAGQSQNDIDTALRAREPYLDVVQKIRDVLGKPEWDFSLLIKKEKKQRRMILRSAECQGDEISVQLDQMQLRQCIGMPERLDDYMDRIARKLAGRAHEIQKRRSQAIRESFLKQQSTILRASIAKITSNAMMQVTTKCSSVSYKVKRNQSRVDVELYCDNMTLQCCVFSAKGNADVAIFQDLVDLKWLIPYIQTIKNPAGLDEGFFVDTKERLQKILNERERQLQDSLRTAVFHGDAFGQYQYNATELAKKAQEYLAWRKSWIDGTAAYDAADVCVTYQVQTGYPILKNAIGFIALTGEQPAFYGNEQYNRFLKCKTNKMQQRCREYAVKAFQTFGMVTCGNNANGILYGNTALTIQRGPLQLEHYLYKTDSFENSVTAWRKTLAKNIKEIEQEFEKLEEKRKTAFVDRYRLYVDSFLVRDIVKVIQANESYITANAVIQVLRGTKVTLNADIEYADEYGAYSWTDVDTIQNCIVRLSREHMLDTKELKGTYGRFEILKINASFKNDLAEIGTIAHEIDHTWSKKIEYNIQKKIHEKQPLSDPEAEKYFERHILAVPQEDPAAYMEMFALLPNRAVVEKQADKIKEKFSDAPEIVKQYAKMRISQSTDIKEKKIMKQLFII